MAEITFFVTPAALRRWFEENHATARELHVGYYRKDSGKPSVTWAESVEQALCFGWIDGVRHKIDAVSFTNRFTPRRVGSNWSEVNIKTAQELIANGLMHPAGLKAFEMRRANQANGYTYENRPETLDPQDEELLRANPAAWAFWCAKSPSYRRNAIWWVISAKQEVTRRRRMETLIEDCAAGRLIKAVGKT